MQIRTYIPFIQVLETNSYLHEIKMKKRKKNALQFMLLSTGFCSSETLVKRIARLSFSNFF